MDLVSNILGQGTEAEIMWTIINRQAMYAFRMEVRREGVSQGYLRGELLSGLLRGEELEEGEDAGEGEGGTKGVGVGRIEGFEVELVDHYETKFDK